MKIKIKTDGTKFTLFLPMCFGSFMIKNMLTRESGQCGYSLSYLHKELKKARKNFGHIKIVDVRSANGDIVEITL